MRRRFKVVMDLLGAMIRSGVSLSRSVELASQWDKVLAIGPSYPVNNCDPGCCSGFGYWCIF